MSTTYIVLIVLGVVVFWAILAYNNFVKFVQRTKEAWADIDVQLKRRYDLIPNLVETVKGYATHERETFDAVTNARAEATKVHVDPSKITPETLKQDSAKRLVSFLRLQKRIQTLKRIPTSLSSNVNFQTQKIKFKQLDDSTTVMCVILRLPFSHFLQTSLEICSTSRKSHISSLVMVMLPMSQ